MKRLTLRYVKNNNNNNNVPLVYCPRGAVAFTDAVSSVSFRKRATTSIWFLVSCPSSQRLLHWHSRLIRSFKCLQNRAETRWFRVQHSSLPSPLCPVPFCRGVRTSGWIDFQPMFIRPGDEKRGSDLPPSRGRGMDFRADFETFTRILFPNTSHDVGLSYRLHDRAIGCLI